MCEALDSQVTSAVKRTWPFHWNMAMLPDVAQLAEIDVESRETLLEAAEQEEWQAKFRTFQLKLIKDTKAIDIYLSGHEKLNDFLDFISIRKRKDQAEKAESLIQRFADNFAPVLTVGDVTEIPAEYAQLRHEVASPGKSVYVPGRAMYHFFGS